MDGLTLLRDARALGFTVRAVGDRLIVRGPKAHESVARTLLARKAEVMAALAAPEPSDIPKFPRATGPSAPRPSPPNRCYACRRVRWWSTTGENWTCGACHPPTHGHPVTWFTQDNGESA